MAISARKSTALKPAAEKVKAPEFILFDYRILNLQAERFLAPEVASTVTFQVSSDVKSVSVPEVGGPSVGLVHYEVKVEGKRMTEDGNEPVKSFSVKIELEGQYNIVNCTVDGPDQIAAHLPQVIQQLHTLAIEKLRGVAQDLGYRGVRPSLGLARERAERHASDMCPASTSADQGVVGTESEPKQKKRRAPVRKPK